MPKRRIQVPVAGLTQSPPSTLITWNNTIETYFLTSNIAGMKGIFDLSKQAEVPKYADIIYKSVVSKKKPLQVQPYTQKNLDPNHPLWTEEMCKRFKEWQAGGCKQMREKACKLKQQLLRVIYSNVPCTVMGRR